MTRNSRHRRGGRCLARRSAALCLALERLEERSLLSTAPSAYGQLPLSFEPNVGQTNSQVSFLSRGAGYSLFLTSAEAVLSLHGSAARQNALGLRLVGADASAVPQGRDPLPGVSNYLLGNDPSNWRTNIPTFAQVVYQGVYPGVDLVYHGSQGRLEYDFVVGPGASPGEIRFAVDGADSLRLDAQGNLVLHTAAGDLVERAPVVYQEIGGGRQPVSGRFVLQNNGQVGFAVGAHDASVPLTIDPVLGYSTYLGGSGTDQGQAIAVDAAGEAFVTGSTFSTDFPTVFGAFQPQGPAGSGQTRFVDAFVAKLNAAGTALLYSTYLGGTGADLVQAIAVDAQGNAYIAGNTSSSDFPTVNPAQQLFGGGGTNGLGDAFVAKLDPSGARLLYSTYLGGTTDDIAYGIAVDQAGSAYVAGATQSTNFPTVNPLQSQHGGGPNSEDAFVAKFSPAGNTLVYSTYLGTGSVQANAIAIDSSGSAYLTGFTLSPSSLPTVNAYQPSFGGFIDAFVSKLNAAGTALVYSTYLGGSDNDHGQGIAVDNAGDAYVSGWTDSSDFPTAGASLHPNKPPGTDIDAFVTKFNSSGTGVVYSTYLGGRTPDYGYAIAVDSLGDAYVTGSTSSGDFPTVNAVQPVRPFQVTNSIFVSKIAPSGSQFVYSTFLGGATDSAAGFGIAADGAGNTYMVGTTGAYDFPTVNAIQPGVAGFQDAVVVKIQDNLFRPTDVGVAVDGSARLLWDSSNNSTALWSVSSSGVTAGTPTSPQAGLTGQATAVGGDGLTRVLWGNSNRSAVLWLINPDGSLQKSGIFGPFDGWRPTDVTVGTDNQTRILWTNLNGGAVVWSVDNNFNVAASSPVFGPFSGWTARALSVGADGVIRLLWTSTTGQAAVWLLNASDALMSAVIFGPIAGGWTAQDVAGGAAGTSYLLWTTPGGAAALWDLSGSMVLTSSEVFGPLAGWTAEHLDAGGGSSPHLLWCNLDGAAALWILNADGSFNTAAVYGPY